VPSVCWKVQDIYRCLIIPHLIVNFILHLLNYLLISSILLCSVLYWSEMSSAQVQRASILYCVDICNWIKGSELLILG
jgi:hypothetical protein